MKESAYRGILIAVSIVFSLLISAQSADQWLRGSNDFAPFYEGTKLVGTGDLYQSQPYYSFLRERFGGINESLRYTRPPHHALMFWPLGLLSYGTAHLVWTLLRLGAVAGFLYLWRRPTRADAVMFTALCWPLFTSMFNGQDTPFLLLWIALALHFQSKDRPFLSGLLFALCAAKFHLFILLPVLLLSQRRWRMTAGLAAGAAVLLVASFAVAGATWPMEYIATLTDGRVHPAAEHMPNLHGMFHGLPMASLLELLASLAVVAGAWLVAGRSSFEVGLAAVLSGGVLLSYHAYVADCLVLLPAALLVLSTNPSFAPRISALVLLAPVPYFLIGNSAPLSYVTHASILFFFGSLVVTAGRETSAAPSLQPSRAGLEPA